MTKQSTFKNAHGDEYRVEKIGSKRWIIKTWDAYYKAWIYPVGSYRIKRDAVAAIKARG